MEQHVKKHHFFSTSHPWVAASERSCCKCQLSSSGLSVDVLDKMVFRSLYEAC